MSSRVKPLLFATILWALFPARATSAYLHGEAHLAAAGAEFSWDEARSKSLKILVESQDRDGTWRRAALGSGFLISPEGLFVTAYHVMKYCLEQQKERSRLATGVDCSAEHPILRYRAQSGDAEYEIEIVSYLKEQDSISGKKTQTPDETIKHRDFVIGRLKAAPQARFPYWQVRDFKEGTINRANPAADFEFKPLLPPKKVFIVGYPGRQDFVISHGFLNLTEANNRGYFAADLKIYTPGYLKNQGIAPETEWGIRVENHMSGGAVIDSSGFVVGLLVNGDARTAGVLSIENVLETFFSRSKVSGGSDAVILNPTRSPLYLKKTHDD
ncbi:MAG: S1 family peptidase [Candidatus Binatia bacterium]